MKPLWALAGTALLGTAGGVGIVIASTGGGEKESVQFPDTATASPTIAASSPGWTRYESTKWGYRIDYPSGWYDLPNFGAPDAQKYFSNEPVRAPLEMDENGVWITITVSNLVGQDCANASLDSGVIESSSDLPIAGGAVARRVVRDTSVEGGPKVVLNLESNGSCYTFYIITLSENTRREVLPLIDEVLESFVPPSATSLSFKGALPELTPRSPLC